MDNLANDRENRSNQDENSHKLCDKTDTPKSRCEFDEKSMETETATWSDFPNRGKVIVKQILAPEETNKSKRAGLWVSQSVIRVGNVTIWIKLFEIKKL